MPETATELSYIPREILTYIPTGWSIYPGDRGRWDGSKGRWVIRVLDSTQTDWDLVITADAARAKGRVAALRDAFDELYRTRLG